MLHHFELGFYQIQSIHALLELLRELGEQRRDFGIFEVIEL